MYESENRDKGTISNNSNQTVDEHMHQISAYGFYSRIAEPSFFKELIMGFGETVH